MPDKRKKPPNYRQSQSCGTCQHWRWGYEGSGDCQVFRRGTDESTMVCDDYKAYPKTKE